MAYTTINKSTDHFNTVTYTGNASGQTISGVGHQPDFIWVKQRGDAGYDHSLHNSVSGVLKKLATNKTDAEVTNTDTITSTNADGFVLGADTAGPAANSVNQDTKNYVAWNWKAGGTAPSQTYVVKVVSDSGNKYRFDDFGTSAVTLDLQEGGTYTFDQSDSSNSGHPLRFSTTSNGSHGGGSEYTTGVTTNGTPGSSGAYTRITVAASAPTLYYYCTSHSGMGGQANTNSLFGSSNFSGSIQSTVSVNATAGFSIVSYTGNGSSNQTVGHGLGVKPAVMILKNRDDTNNWVMYHQKLNNGTNPEVKYLELNTNNAQLDDASIFNDTAPTSSVFTIGSASDTGGGSGGNNEKIIAYCFAEKTGYSRFSSYTGNGNADGTFVYTGFKPAFVMVKRYDGAGLSWRFFDSKRNYNGDREFMYANLTDSEVGGDNMDFLSNGFKNRNTSGHQNGNSDDYIYMAFAEAPLVGSNNVPATAR